MNKLRQTALFPALLSAACLISLLIASSCSGPSVRLGMKKGDLRSAAAPVANSMGFYSETDLKVEIIEFTDVAGLAEALRKNELNVAYIDALEALKLAATGAADLKIIAIANRSEYKPQTLLAAMAQWAAENRQACDDLLKAHRRATALLQSGDPEAVRIAARWAGVNPGNLDIAMPRLHLEGGIDRAAFIDLLEDLRVAGDISPQQADDMARKLVREQGESAR